MRLPLPATLGMRPSSAILFTSEDLKVTTENGDTVYRYRVNNHKVGEYMPVSQILHPAFGRKLKKLPVFTKKNKTSFNNTVDLLCDKLNLIIAEKLSEPRVKSLRKGFVTETMAEGRVSKSFDTIDARRITHIISDTADKKYNCDKQTGCDKVMEWWNAEWYRQYKHYASMYKTEFDIAKDDTDKGCGELMITLDEAEYDFLVRRSKFDRGLKEVIDDDEN